MNEELRILELADYLKKVATTCPAELLSKLDVSANNTGKAWCGSWLGYHSKVYYKDLQPIPPGAHFSKEWGFTELHALKGTTGEWTEYDFDDLVAHIKHTAGIEDLNPLEGEANKSSKLFEEAQAEILSLLTSILSQRETDSFLKDLSEKIKEEKIFTYRDYVKYYQPRGQQISRDSIAIHEGIQVPPHISVLAEVMAIRGAYTACENLSKYSRRVVSHIENISKREVQSKQVGTNVFIGHGRSAAWRDLKDFIQDRLHLPWDEFNRVPVAGFTNIARLSEMMNEAVIAFLIMTAEDEQADGKLHARMNVIHEAGLFQGRLGFERAIIVLEEGCEEFTNVQGLGQIKFPAGNISAVFEEIRRILEREKLIE